MSRSLLRHASPLIAGRAASAALTFVIPIVLARRLPASEYGTYKQFFLVAASACLMGQIGVPASLYYFLPRAGAERGRYVVQALAALLALGALAAGVVLATAGELAYRFDNPRYAALASALAAYVAAALAAWPLEPMLTASGRTGWAGLAYVTSDLARTVALVAPVLAGRGLDGLAWCAAAFAGVRLVAAWVLALAGAAGPPLLPARGALRAQARHALPFGAAVLLAVAQTQLPQYAVAALTDAATYAIFAVGVLQLPVTDMIYASIVEVMMVRLAGAGRAGTPPVFREAIGRLALFFLPLAAFAVAVADELIPALYTPQYAAAGAIFAIGAGEIALATLPVDGLLRALDATGTIFRVNAARLAIAAVAVPSAVILWGLRGAIAAHVGVQLVGKLLLFRAAARRLDVPVRALVPARALAGWAARAGGLLVALEALRTLGPWRGWAYLAAASALAGALWLASLALSGELRRPAAAPAREASSPR